MNWFLYDNGSVMKGLRVNKEPVKDLYIALVARAQIQKILILVIVSSPDILFLIFNISLNNLEATFWYVFCENYFKLPPNSKNIKKIYVRIENHEV